MQEETRGTSGGPGFEQVVVPHLDAAHNLARWLVADATLAEDVVQDSVVRALNYFGSYRGGDAPALLLQIGANNAYSALGVRKRGGMTSLDSMEPGPDGEHPAL